MLAATLGHHDDAETLYTTGHVLEERTGSRPFLAEDLKGRLIRRPGSPDRVLVSRP